MAANPIVQPQSGLHSHKLLKNLGCSEAESPSMCPIMVSALEAKSRMGVCTPSEDQLVRAIQLLSPGAFERLVEIYLRVKKPSRFQNLTIIGRNQDDSTRQGWPDAEVRRADGQIDAIEITHSEDWRRHLRADLQRIGGLRAKIASFHFVAWADSPSRDTEQALRKSIATACGAPLEEIYFLFRKSLIFDLSNPRYAKIWADNLSLPLTSFPFVGIDSAYQLFGSDIQYSSVRVGGSSAKALFINHRFRNSYKIAWQAPAGRLCEAKVHPVKQP